MLRSGRIKIKPISKDAFLTGYGAQTFIPTVQELQNIFDTVYTALKNNLGTGNVLVRYISHEFGNDSYDGSWLWPFKTLDGAVYKANLTNKYFILLSHLNAGNTVYFNSDLDLSRIYIIGGKWNEHMRCVRNDRVSYRFPEYTQCNFSKISFLANIYYNQGFEWLETFSLSTTHIRKYTNLAHILYCEVLSEQIDSSYQNHFSNVNGDLCLEKSIIRSREHPMG